MGGLLSSAAGHFFDPVHVFVGSAMVSLMAAALWLLLLHAVVRPQRKLDRRSSPRQPILKPAPPPAAV